MRVALVGGAGFVGWHIANALLASDHEPVIFDMNESPGRKVHTMNVQADSAIRMAERMEEHDLDALILLAAISNTNTAYRHPTLTWDVNVLGADKVLRACHALMIDKVIVAGSSLVSGAMNEQIINDDDYMDEDNDFEVRQVKHPYVASKIALEFVAQTHRSLYGLPVCVFRYGIMYGPRMAPGVVAHAFITRGLKGEDLIIHGNGSQWRQYLHVADLADAHLAALEQWESAKSQTFNVVPSWKTSINDMATAVQKEIPGLTARHVEARTDDIGVQMLSPKKARRRLGWQAQIELEEGIAGTIEWYRANG